MGNQRVSGEGSPSRDRDLIARMISESKAFAKSVIGRLAVAVFPAEASKLEKNLDNYTGGWIQKALKAGLFQRAGSAGASGLLAEYHRMYWRSPKAEEYYARSEQRFKEWFLDKHSVLIDVLEAYVGSCASRFTRLYDMGCGSGLTTGYLAWRLPHLAECVGIDLSATLIAQNNQANKNHRVRFEAGNAREWVRANGKSNAVFFTYGGVLEYFTGEELGSLLRYIASHLRPALFISIEPVSMSHDLERDVSSKPHGPEMSFSHNYPSAFRHEGFKIEFVEDRVSNGIRWLLMLSSAL